MKNTSKRSQVKVWVLETEENGIEGIYTSFKKGRSAMVRLAESNDFSQAERPSDKDMAKPGRLRWDDGDGYDSISLTWNYLS